MRPRDTLTPEQERDLEAIDRVLADEPVEFQMRELEDLVRDVRATAPQMTPAFAARLEHEVAEGFPTPREAPSRVRGSGRRWLLLPAMGSLAAVIVALVVVLGGGSSPSSPTDFSAAPSARSPEASPSAGSAGDESASSDAAGAGSSGARDRKSAPAQPAAAAPAPSSSSTATPAPASSAQSVAPAVKRKVQRSAALTLETPDGTFDETTDKVGVVVAQFGGIVANSQIGASDESGGEATFELRIPTDRLDRALAALAKLGHVTERSQSLDDITGSFTSAQERLTDARAERRGLLRALGRATTQSQIAGIKAQLRNVSSQISGLKGQLASLRRRADLATVSLTVRGGAQSSGTTGGGGHWTPGDAAGDALRVLEVLAGVLLIGLAVLVPAGLIGVAIAFGMRIGRRRRREAALDPA
jgi:hypothetical protein